MDVTYYTSYREVRTACGLTQHDISDDMLSDQMFENELYVALTSVTLPDEDPGPGTLIDRFAEINGTAEASRTDNEKLLLALTRLYSTYVLANLVCKSIPMLAAKMRTDGKTSDARFSTDLVIKSVQKNVLDKLASYKRQIENITGSDPITYRLFKVVPPATDVVTNE